MAKETEFVNLSSDDDTTEDWEQKTIYNKKPSGDKQKKILKNLREQICDLESKNEKLKQELENSKLSLTYSEQYENESQNKMKDLEQLIKLLEQELVLHKQNENDHEANESELKEAVKQSQGLLNEASDHFEQRQMELDEKENSITLLRLENDTLKLQIEAMNKDKLQDKINQLEDKFNQLKYVKDVNRKCCKREFQELNAEMDRLRERIAAVEKDKKVLCENIYHEQSMTASFRLQLEWKDDEAVTFRQLASRFEEENRNLKRQIDKLEHLSLQNNRSLRKYSSESVEFARCKNELKKCQEEMGTLRAEISAKQMQIKILGNEINQFKEEKQILADAKAKEEGEQRKKVCTRG